MTDTLQLEDAVQLRSSARCAQAPDRSVAAVAGFVTLHPPRLRPTTGAPSPADPLHGIFPYRGTLAALLLEAFLVFVVVVLPREIDKLHPRAPKVRPYEVIYYSGDELPRTEALGSAARSHRPRRWSRSTSPTPTSPSAWLAPAWLVPKVVDDPNLKVSFGRCGGESRSAFKATSPGPPPSEGLRSYW